MYWMDANQLGRRNLSLDAFKLALGRRYNRTKKARGGTGANQHKQKGQIDLSATNTAANLAAEHSVSEATVKRAGKFADEVTKTADTAPAGCCWSATFNHSRPNSFAGGFTIAGRRRSMTAARES